MVICLVGNGGIRLREPVCCATDMVSVAASVLRNKDLPVGNGRVERLWVWCQLDGRRKELRERRWEELWSFRLGTM